MKKQIAKIIFMTMAIAQLSFLSTNVLGAEVNPVQESQSVDKIKIDIVSDIVCPWCAIGYQRLRQAINEMKMEDKVQIEWHPFELNPDMPLEGVNANKYLMKKYRLSPDKLIRTRNNVTKLGAEVGFKFDYFEDMKKLNTFYAHIVLDYAKEFNKQTELEVRLTEAYFSERKDISDRNVLYLELKRVGLNADEAIARLDNNEARKNVQNEERHWLEQGVSSIPTMIFNSDIVLEGAVSVDTYKKVLTKMIKKD